MQKLFTSQPKENSLIFSGSPLSRGLVLALNMATPNVDGQGRKNVIVGTRKNPSNVGVSAGFGATFGVGTTDSIETGLNTSPVQRSYYALLNIRGLGGSSLGRIFEKLVSGAAEVLLYTRVSGTNQLTLIHDFTTTQGLWTVPLPAFGGWNSIAVTYDSGAVANNPKIWINGVPQTVTVVTAPVGTATTNIDNYVIGNRKNDNARNFDGDIAAFYMWDRLLTDAEVNSLSVNPWQIWQPIRVMELNGPASGAGVASGNATSTGSLVGASAAASTVSGGATSTGPLVGASTAAATVSGGATSTGSEVGASTAESTVSGNATTAGSEVGASTAASTVSGGATSTGPVVGASAAASTVSGNATSTGTEVGASTATAPVSGNATSAGSAVGASTGTVTATVSGGATSTGFAVGKSAGQQDIQPSGGYYDIWTGRRKEASKVEEVLKLEGTEELQVIALKKAFKLSEYPSDFNVLSNSQRDIRDDLSFEIDLITKIIQERKEQERKELESIELRRRVFIATLLLSN